MQQTPHTGLGALGTHTQQGASNRHSHSDHTHNHTHNHEYNQSYDNGGRGAQVPGSTSTSTSAFTFTTPLDGVPPGPLYHNHNHNHAHEYNHGHGHNHNQGYQHNHYSSGGSGVGVGVGVEQHHNGYSVPVGSIPVGSIPLGRSVPSSVGMDTPFLSPGSFRALSKNPYTLANLANVAIRYTHSIATNSETRNVFFFLLLNLSFTAVEFFYGWASGSLGLTADAVHMLFDSTALIMSLVAGVISKWPSTDSYPFAFRKVEILTGFLNALALLYASVEVIHEAIHRIWYPEPLAHTSVFVVSVLGLLVNIVGIYAFDHGGHAGHNHGHNHNHNHNHNHDHGHDHNHNHNHNHGHSKDMIMEGMYLHVLADTLGSVAVVLSTIVSYIFDFSWADPICSILIAILTTYTTWPLLKKSCCMLLDNKPDSINMNSVRSRVIACSTASNTPNAKITATDVRIWSMSSSSTAATVRVSITGLAQAKAQSLADVHKAIESVLLTEFGVAFCSVQVDLES